MLNRRAFTALTLGFSLACSGRVSPARESIESRSSANGTVANRAAERRTSENRATANPTADNRTAENQSSSHRTQKPRTVVIVGSGAAGLSAALSAKENGAGTVVVLEKASFLGGHTAFAGGSVNFVDSSRQEKRAFGIRKRCGLTKSLRRAAALTIGNSCALW